MVTGAPTVVAIVPAIAQRSSLSVIRSLSDCVPLRMFLMLRRGHGTGHVVRADEFGPSFVGPSRRGGGASRRVECGARPVPRIPVRLDAARHERHPRDTPSPLPKESRWIPAALEGPGADCSSS